jgi:hypothetical protein
MKKSFAGASPVDFWGGVEGGESLDRFSACLRQPAVRALFPASLPGRAT